MTIAVCTPPHAELRPPAKRAPPKSCDCHLHIIGPEDRYPLFAGRSYTPCDASIEAYEAIQRTLGTERLVVVQASVYGTDNTRTLDALAHFGPTSSRGIVVVDADVDDATLARMHDAGVRGVRFNVVTRGGPPLAALREIAARIAPLGWHLQVYAEGDRLIEIAPLLRALPVEVVLDHMGGLHAGADESRPERRVVRDLLAGGRTWIKLCGYRASRRAYPFADIADLATDLVHDFPDRCVWGTDWPHPAFAGDMPHDGELLDALMQWAPTSDLQQRVLVDNPARLYGFD